MHQDVTLNIPFSAPDVVWEKLGKVYEQMPYWAGTERGPKWIGIGDSVDLWASVEPGGLQIAGVMPDAVWTDWYAVLKEKLTAALGYEVGESVEGYEFQHWDLDGGI